MREILIISGKGGTGKTSITAAFAHLSKKTVLCDLDVDAPDMHILLQTEKIEHHDFWSGNYAFIYKNICVNCGICKKACKFNAIKELEGKSWVENINCEGCKLCVELCPNKAIDFKPKQCGEWYLSKTKFGKFVHAKLFPGEENSGRLIALIRKRAKELAQENRYDFILCDGPPGIGCPVISSISGVNSVVVVTEPNPSGLHDLERILDLCSHFNIHSSVIINKYNINEAFTKKIQSVCKNKGIEVIGKVLMDQIFVEAMIKNKAVTEMNNYKSKWNIEEIWQRVKKQK